MFLRMAQSELAVILFTLLAQHLDELQAYLRGLQ